MASASAASSTMPPRAQLMMRTPRFMRAIESRPMSPRVSAVSGVWMVMKSARGKSASSDTSSTRSRAAASGVTKGS